MPLSRAYIFWALPLALLLLAAPAAAQMVDFGDNASDYANDGECDDRRFKGPGMAAELGWADVTHDADDCRAAMAAGEVTLWIQSEAVAATDCAAIDYGSNASSYSDDGVCDDPRFEGWGAAEISLSEDEGTDANDCRRLCEFGLIGLRDY